MRSIIYCTTACANEIARCSKGQRPDKFTKLKTIEDIGVLAEREAELIKQRAKVIAAGNAAGSGGQKTVGTLLNGSGKKRRVGGEEVIEVEISGKKSALDVLNLEFILWGHSQGAQVAGVCCLSCAVSHLASLAG